MFTRAIILSILFVGCVAGVALSGGKTPLPEDEDDLFQSMMDLSEYAKKHSANPCDLCTHIVDHWRTTGTINRWVQKSEAECAKLGDRADYCKRMVDDFAKLLNSGTPVDVCQHFKFCPAAN